MKLRYKTIHGHFEFQFSVLIRFSPTKNATYRCVNSDFHFSIRDRSAVPAGYLQFINSSGNLLFHIQQAEVLCIQDKFIKTSGKPTDL